MIPIHFNNQYGSATLTPVTEVMPVAMISTASMPSLISEVSITAEQAEQLALITENNRIQITYSMGMKLFYVVFHETSSTVMLCRAMIDYVGEDGIRPAEIIDSLLRLQCMGAVSFGR